MLELFSQGGKIIVAKWFDNKRLHLASTFTGIGEADKCKRWDKDKKNTYILFGAIERHKILQFYNACMGGVDKMNFMIQIRRTFIKSKRWTLPMQ